MAKASSQPDRSSNTPITSVVRMQPCGWCNTGDHEHCKHEIRYYEKLWICGCECNKNWIPSTERSDNDNKENHEETLEQVVQEEQQVQEPDYPEVTEDANP